MKKRCLKKTGYSNEFIRMLGEKPSHTRGMVIFCGTTGGGMSQLKPFTEVENGSSKRICVFEKPIEYPIDPDIGVHHQVISGK